MYTVISFVEDRHGHGKVINEKVAAVLLFDHESKLLHLLLLSADAKCSSEFSAGIRLASSITLIKACQGAP